MKIMDLISKNYYQPDPTWEMFGATSPDLFVEKFVVHPKFHTDVHEDVAKDYSIVEHMMALCYYHYPMYELSLDKLLRIYEMAINLRCYELGIEKTLIDKNERNKTKNLVQLIDELIQIDMIPEFESVMHNIRKIRNFSSHPERYSNMGIIAGQVIFPILNMINLIFLGKDSHVKNRHNFELIKQKIIKLRDSLFILEQDGLKILAYDLDMHDCYKKGKDWICIFSFLPIIMNSEEKIRNHQSPDRVLRFLRSPIINEDSISGFDIVNTEEVFLETTRKDENIERLNKQFESLKNSDKIDSFHFLNDSKEHADRKSQQFIYETRWV